MWERKKEDGRTGNELRARERATRRRGGTGIGPTTQSRPSLSLSRPAPRLPSAHNKPRLSLAASQVAIHAPNVPFTLIVRNSSPCLTTRPL